MIVVDTNIIAYAVLEGEKNAWAGHLWERDNQWVVPALWRHEFLNVLVTTTRSGALSPGAATEAWQRAVELYGENESALDLKEVLETAMRYRITGYDAQFLHLSLLLGVPLISEDRALQQAAPDRVWSMEQYLDG